MRSTLWLVALVLAFACSVHAEKHREIQSSITALSPTATDAVIPVTFWTDSDDSRQATIVGVVGTGFLVDDQGDFVTAAHVVNLQEIGPADHRIKVRLFATIRQRSNGGSSQSFTILEIDSEHDLALCHIDGFKVYSEAKSPTARAGTATEIAHPFASLAVSKSSPRVGDFVLVSGFPLGSWTPTIQLGLISATRTIYPPGTPVAGVPRGTENLLQISVSANHGNSGGPVINLNTGEVIGVLLQIVPAPLAIQGRQIYDAGTFDMSGIMLAAPASWVNDLLARHNVKSRAVAGRLVAY